MNLADARVVLRPRGVGEIFDLSLRWQATVARGLYLRLAALTLLPAALVCYALVAFGDSSWFAAWALAAVLASILHGLFTLAASRLMFEQEVRTGAVLREFVQRTPAYLGALAVTGLFYALACLLAFLVPFVWLRTSVVREAVLLERAPALAALRRSKAVSERSTGSALGILLAQATLIGLSIFYADALAGMLFEFFLQMSHPLAELNGGGSLAGLLGLFAAVPLVATLRFFFYIDARTRLDGWDLQLSFSALAAREHVEGPP